MVEDGKQKQVVGSTIIVPAGANSGGLVNFQHKVFAKDLFELKLKPTALEQRLTKELGPDEARALIVDLRMVSLELLKQVDKPQPVQTLRKYPKLLEFYSTCTADIENDGHPFQVSPTCTSRAFTTRAYSDSQEDVDDLYRPARLSGIPA